MKSISARKRSIGYTEILEAANDAVRFSPRVVPWLVPCAVGPTVRYPAGLEVRHEQKVDVLAHVAGLRDETLHHLRDVPRIADEAGLDH